jgi:hypothetical protein
MSRSLRIKLDTSHPSMIGGMIQNWSDEIDNRKFAADMRHRRQTLRPVDRERKEILALLIEDVTIVEDHGQLTAHVRLRGGSCRTLRTYRWLR